MAGSDKNSSEAVIISAIKIAAGIIGFVIAGIGMLLKHVYYKLKERQSADLLDITQRNKNLGNISPLKLRNKGELFALIGIGGLWLGFIIVSQSMGSSGSSIVELVGFTVMVAGGGFAVYAFIDKYVLSVRNANKVPQTAIETVATAQPSPAYMFTITLPRQTSWDSQRALHFMEQILAEFGSLIFEIVADYSCIRWRIIDMNARVPDPIERSIRAAYPDADIAVAPWDLDYPPYPHYRYVALYQHNSDFIKPMRFVTDTKSLDPLAQLVQAMDSLQPDERIAYTLVTIGWAIEAHQEADLLLTQSGLTFGHLLTPGGRYEAIERIGTNTDRESRYSPEAMKVMMDKYGQRLYQAVLFIQVDSPYKERIPQLINIDSHLINFGTPYNAIVRFTQDTTERTIEINDAHTALRLSSLGVLNSWANDPTNSKQDLRRNTRLILDPRELALLWHLPHEQFAAQKIQWIASRRISVPNAFVQNREGIHLGTGWVSGRFVPVYLKEADRAAHINIIGKPGTGKSTLLHHMITQDIADGKGVAVIDPHGALVADVLRRSIETNREQDVVILDMADSTYPPPLNPLRGKMGQVRIGNILAAIEQLFPSTINYPRLSRYLQAAFGLIQSDPEATLRDVVRVFTCAPYRHSLLHKTANDDVLLTWQEYDKFSEDKRRELLDPILSRLSPFYSNELLYPAICHPDGLDFRTIIKEKKILLVSLKMDDELVPEHQQNIIGSLIISRLQTSGMAVGSEQEKYHVYIDEVQRFATSSLDVMLSEARKFGVSLTVAHQFLRQLSTDTLEALLGTVGATIAFQSSPHDARALGMHFAPQFKPDDLVHLDRHQAATTMQLDGASQPAFTLFTQKMREIPKDGMEREQHIRELSRRQWTPKTNEQVSQWLKERYTNGGCPDPSTQDVQTQFEDPI